MEVVILRLTRRLCFVSQLILIASLLDLTDCISGFLSRSHLIVSHCHFSMSMSFTFFGVVVLVFFASYEICFFGRSDSGWSKGGKSSR